MAATATEIYGKSESGAINANGSKTVTRRFHVANDSFGTNLTLQQALAGTGLPAEPVNDVSQDTFQIDGETLSYWGTRNFQRVEGHTDLWLLTYEYSTSPDPAGDGTGTERSGSSRATAKGVYRANVTPPLNTNNPSKQDIGGTRIDVGGQKTTIAYPSTSLLIKQYRSTPVYAYEFVGAVGRRNSNAWNGFPSGSVLFVGANYSLNNSTNMWEIEYEFAIDLLTSHLEQVAKTMPSGEVLTERSGNSGEETFSAAHVYWVQPFGTTVFGFPT